MNLKKFNQFINENHDEKYYDLFEHPEMQPQELKDILAKYENSNDTYDVLEQLLKEVEAIGYTFNYYLDATPYGLRPKHVKLEDLEGFENS